MRTKFSIYRHSLQLGLILCVALVSACGGGGGGGDSGQTANGPASAGPGTVALSWDAPPVPVAGYRVYSGTVSRNYSQARGSGDFTANSNYTAQGLQSGRKYYFAVTAIDASGAESAYSNEASKTIP